MFSESLHSSPSQKRRENVCQSLNIETPDTNYGDILQRLVRRYLFKLERQKDEGKHLCPPPSPPPPIYFLWTERQRMSVLFRVVSGLL